MSKKDYSELYGVLLMLGKNYFQKLPDNVIQWIKMNRDINYEPEYLIDSIEYEENILPAVLECLASFYLEYWQSID